MDSVLWVRTFKYSCSWMEYSMCTALYNPSSNGQVERAVQTFKHGFKQMKEGKVTDHIAMFLFSYRITPHTMTGVSPAELMFGRKCHSCLDLLLPDHTVMVEAQQQRQKEKHDLHAHSLGFSMGKQVYARNFRPGEAWLPGCIIKATGPVLFLVKRTDGQVIRRHLDHVRKQLQSRRHLRVHHQVHRGRHCYASKFTGHYVSYYLCSSGWPARSMCTTTVSTKSTNITVFNVLLFLTYSSSTWVIYVEQTLRALLVLNGGRSYDRTSVRLDTHTFTFWVLLVKWNVLIQIILYRLCTHIRHAPCALSVEFCIEGVVFSGVGFLVHGWTGLPLLCMCLHCWWHRTQTLHKPLLQVFPAQPRTQLHVSGDEQVPPFWQVSEHTAVK